jgi:hypothetical protein
MRFPTKLAIALGAATIVAYAELVVDIRTPVSDLSQTHALGASASLSLSEYNQKVAQFHQRYGDRAHVILETSSGKVRVELDGKAIEEWQIERQFAGIYGMFVVSGPAERENIFPFDIEPGKIPEGQEPNIARLRSHFEAKLPAKDLDFGNEDWARGFCAVPPLPEIGFGQFANWLHIRSETFCVVHWNGAGGGSMSVSVTLADGNPWMRPFSRRLCRAITETALTKLATSGRERPNYAACVLVDRPDRTGSTGAQTAFTSEVYEVRSHDLARIP